MGLRCILRSNMSDQSHDYHPLIDTLRLYAGWLLACLFVIYAVGGYQQLRQFPFRLSILDEWTASPMILSVTLVTFLFLLLSSVHRVMGRGFWKGLALAVMGFGVMVGFRIGV